MSSPRESRPSVSRPDLELDAELAAEICTFPNSTLSHHLEKLKNENVVTVMREGVFLRHKANHEALRELLAFLYAECCTRNQVVEPAKIICCGKDRP